MCSFRDIIDELDLDLRDLLDLGMIIEETEGYDCDSDNEEKEYKVDLEINKTNKTKRNKIKDTKIKALVEGGVSYEEAPHPNLLPTPFSLIGNGKPGSGKSTTLMNLLLFYKGYFDNIYIWSPTIGIDISWKQFFKNNPNMINKKNIFKSFKQDTMKKLMKEIKKVNKNKKDYPDKVKTLFIFDDIISELPRKQKGYFNKMLFNHRHYGISHITLSQEYVAIPPKMRKSSFGMMLYNTDNCLEREKIVKELGGIIGCDNFDSLFTETTKNKYDFLFVKLAESDLNKKYYLNFEKPINIKDMLENGKYDSDTDDDENEEEEKEES